MEDFRAKYGPWALVTGASRGIGSSFARQCAARGLNVVLVATNRELLADQKRLIESEYGVEARTVSLDLSRDDIVLALEQHTHGLEIGLLVSNAGISTVKPFLEVPEGELLKQFHVNARASLLLARHYGALMATRGRGGIVLLSSASAMNGTAYVANYAGTKAYNLVLAESLWYELRKHGIDVLGFMPGMTRTPGFEKNDPDPARLFNYMEADDAVAEALGSLGRRPSRIAGRLNRLAYLFMKILSRRAAVTIVSRSMEKIFPVH